MFIKIRDSIFRKDEINEIKRYKNKIIGKKKSLRYSVITFKNEEESEKEYERISKNL